MKYVPHIHKLLRRSGIWPREYGQNWLRDVCRSRDWSDSTVILDVGANVGDVSKCLATTFPRCRVHAFEPVASTFSTLTGNLEGFANVSVHNLALSDRVENLKVTSRRDSEINRIVTAHDDDHSDLEMVSTATADDFLAELGWPSVGLLKVDTEGYDLRVLAGCAEAMSKSLIDLVLAECTFNPRGAPHVDVLELIPFMRRNDYEVVAVYSEHVGWFTRGSGHSNILFARSQSNANRL